MQRNYRHQLEMIILQDQACHIKQKFIELKNRTKIHVDVDLKEK